MHSDELMYSLKSFHPISDQRWASVDFKDAKDVRRGGGIAHSVESEGRACDGVQLRAFVQSQEAGHLAGLQEVEGVRPGGGSRPIALHALQLLRPLAAGHNVQLHILRLLLIEQHLRETERGWRDFHLVMWGQQRHQQVFILHYSNRKLTRLPQCFQSPTIVFFCF